jgi:hypothetical protein
MVVKSFLKFFKLSIKLSKYIISIVTEATENAIKLQELNRDARSTKHKILPFIIIIIFINCSWVVTRWQWSFYIV